MRLLIALFSFCSFLLVPSLTFNAFSIGSFGLEVGRTDAGTGGRVVNEASRAVAHAAAASVNDEAQISSNEEKEKTLISYRKG